MEFHRFVKAGFLPRYDSVEIVRLRLRPERHRNVSFFSVLYFFLVQTINELTSAIDSRRPNASIIFALAQNLIENFFLFLTEIYFCIVGAEMSRTRIQD